MTLYAWLTAIVLVACGVMMFYSSWQEYDLIRHGKAVVAQAYDFRVDAKSRHCLRYQFQLDRRGPTYSCADAFGRIDLAVSVRRAIWDEARKTGTVRVLYDVRNPWNSQVDDPSTPPWAVAALAGGFVLLAYPTWRTLKSRGDVQKTPKGAVDVRQMSGHV
jgi:hypothetical protein